MSRSGPELVVLSFHSGKLVGGGHVYRLATPGGTTFLITAARGVTPDLDGAFDDPTSEGIERVLRRNDQLHWVRVSREGEHTWHPPESEARVALSEAAYVVCYGARQVPSWLRDLAGSARPEVVLRMAAAAGLDVATAAFTTTSVLTSGPTDGADWTPGRHLGTGVQGLWAWSTSSWQRGALAAGLFTLALWLFVSTVTVFSTDPLSQAPPGPPGVDLPGSGLPPLELDPCEVLRGGGQPATATFCSRVVAQGSVDPDLWYVAGNTSREIRADLQGLGVLSDATPDDVHDTWAPVVSALFGKLVLVEYMPPEWGVDLVQADSPYLGPTRPVGDSDAEFTAGFPALLAESPRWKALWQGGLEAPDPALLHLEIFGRSRTLAAHGELLAAARH